VWGGPAGAEFLPERMPEVFHPNSSYHLGDGFYGASHLYYECSALDQNKFAKLVAYHRSQRLRGKGSDISKMLCDLLRK
jgi:hypothetical protein